MSELHIEMLEEFAEWLERAPDTFPAVVENILESLGEILLDEAQDALRTDERPHARYKQLTRIRTRGPNKGKARNYLQFVGTESANAIDHGKLLNSLSRGAQDNVWVYKGSQSRFLLTAGSSVEYAKWINDGYDVKKGHWVPGTVDSSGIFRYGKGVDTGIYVKPRSYDGIKFFEVALKNLEEIAPDIIRFELEHWLEGLKNA